MFTCTYDIPISAPSVLEYVWEKKEIALFNELIVSWNGLRPEKGTWEIWVSLHQEEWSPWLHYAQWGVGQQKTFRDVQSFANSYQDACFPKEGVCDGFRVKVLAENGANLADLHALFACASHLPDYAPIVPSDLSSVFLTDVPKQSQMILDHPRCKDLCSPTATTTAINYLLGNTLIEPTSFAAKSHDDHWDIYGNWILNTAAAYAELSPHFSCHVQRLNSFTDLHSFLCKGCPVVVSIRGPIPGSASPYTSGHLICVTGYAPGQVHCIDSAFPETEMTQTTYPLEEFITAWGRRGNIAYVFCKKSGPGGF